MSIPEPFLEEIFATLKCLISFETTVLFNRHLDQLIVCCIYAVCKNHKMDIRFNDIKAKYEELNPANKDEHDGLMRHVYLDSKTRVDIIQFYNGVFISNAKTYVKQVPR